MYLVRDFVTTRPHPKFSTPSRVRLGATDFLDATPQQAVGMQTIGVSRGGFAPAGGWGLGGGGFGRPLPHSSLPARLKAAAGKGGGFSGGLRPPEKSNDSAFDGI